MVFVNGFGLNAILSGVTAIDSRPMAGIDVLIPWGTGRWIQVRVRRNDFVRVDAGIIKTRRDKRSARLLRARTTWECRSFTWVHSVDVNSLVLPGRSFGIETTGVTAVRRKQRPAWNGGSLMTQFLVP